MVKPIVNPVFTLAGPPTPPLGLPAKISTMKNLLFLLLPALALLTASCERDPDPLNLDRFDVQWFDDDQSGTRTAADALRFEIEASTSNGDADEQYFTEWEFTYSVNGIFGGTLLGDNSSPNTITANLDITLDNLALPAGLGSLQQGDQLEFRLWARDNHGTELEKTYQFEIEE